MYNADFIKRLDAHLVSNPDDFTISGITDNYHYRIDKAKSPTRTYVTYLDTSIEELDTVLDEIKQRYKEWTPPVIHVRSNDKPLGLDQELIDRNFINVVNLDFKLFPLEKERIEKVEKSISTSVDPKYELRYLEISDIISTHETYYNLYKSGFPTVPISAEGYLKTHMAQQSLVDKGGFNRKLAYFYEDKPVALAGLMEWANLDGIKLAQLGGALTHPDHQKQGLYSSLIIERIKTAYDQGYDAMLVMANKVSSSPILSKFGFETVDEMSLYANPSWGR